MNTSIKQLEETIDKWMKGGPSGFLDDVVADVKATLKMKQFLKMPIKFNMDSWLTTDHDYHDNDEVETCFVCLAGAVMLQEVCQIKSIKKDIQLNRHYTAYEIALKTNVSGIKAVFFTNAMSAIDDLRIGNAFPALYLFQLERGSNSADYLRCASKYNVDSNSIHNRAKAKDIEKVLKNIENLIENIKNIES